MDHIWIASHHVYRYLPISHFNPFVVSVAGDPIGITPQVGPNVWCKLSCLLPAAPPISHDCVTVPSKSS